MTQTVARPILKGQRRQSHDRPRFQDKLPLPSPSYPFPFSSCLLPSPHVHFPPTPVLNSYHNVDAYDRSPIVVSPNVCSLPDRGARTFRTTSPSRPDRKGSSSLANSLQGSYFHPHANRSVACSPESSPFLSESSPSSPPTPNLTTSPDSDSCIASPLSPQSPNELVCPVMFLPSRPSCEYDSTLLLSPEAPPVVTDSSIIPKRPKFLTSLSVRAPITRSAVVCRSESEPFEPHSARLNGRLCTGDGCLGGF